MSGFRAETFFQVFRNSGFRVAFHGLCFGGTLETVHPPSSPSEPYAQTPMINCNPLRPRLLATLCDDPLHTLTILIPNDVENAGLFHARSPS